MKIKNIRLLALTLALIIGLSVQSQAQTYYTPKKNEIYRKGRIICLLAKKRWKVAKRVNKNSYEIKKNAKAAEKQFCRKLLTPSKSRSLRDLPASESVIQSGTSSMEVSGNPPSVAEIVEAGAENVFFRPDVINAILGDSPTFNQCNEFWGGSNDGESGGIGACYMAENVVYSVSEVARSGTSMCYMRNFPSAANVEAGAVELISGELPNDDIAQVFNTPEGSRPRIVKVGVPMGEEAGQNIFMRIYSSEQNANQGNQYKFDIWFCDDGAGGEAQEYEQTRITAGGEYIASSVHTFEDGQGIGGSTVRGFLSRSGESLVFDPSRERIVNFGGETSGEFSSNFKSSINLNADNEITTKIRQIFGDNSLRKAFSIARFAGSGLSSMQFMEGASKEENDQHAFASASEYRDSYYAASPDSEYASIANAVDFDSDNFYASGASIPEINADFSCDLEADIELALDMENEAMQAVAETCEGDRIDGGSTLFCQSDVLADAQNNWPNVCMDH